MKWVTVSRFLLASLLALCLGSSIPEIWAEDFDDCALLLDSVQLQNSDINFKKICQFYGLRCREIDLRTTELTDQLLRDGNGQRLRGMGINLITLEQKEPALLDSAEVTIIRAAVEDGARLLISGLIPSATPDLSITRQLTDHRVTGIWPAFTNLNWIISGHRPEITREFSGQTIPFEGANCAGSPTLAGSTTVLISSQDRHSPETEYPVFVELLLGSGAIFLDGGDQRESLQDEQLWKFYNSAHFSNLVPTMMFIRFAGADECWHNHHNYANLTIDDPYLIEPSYHLNYNDLLSQMQIHNFHTTIGYIPTKYCGPHDSTVINLFLNYPNRYSIVQHGNNHDGYEFICYTQEQLDSLNVHQDSIWLDQRPRPLSEQEADIVEGKTRLGELQRNTGIPHGDIMIFPWGISLSPTLALLKSYNFKATVNAQYQPYLFLGEDDNNNFDFNMRPANMNFANFPVVKRSHPCSAYDPPVFSRSKWLFQLFVDKPLLLYSHSSQIFQHGMDGFSPAADMINGLAGNTEWKSLGEIIKRMYLQKTNDDGTVSVFMYTNALVLSNETMNTLIYDIQKEEILNVPIFAITVDDIPITYSLTDSSLHFTVSISSGSSKEIAVLYGSGDKDFAISDADIDYEARVSDTLTVTVHNYGADAGPVPVQLFEGHPDSGGTALDLVTIERIEPHSSEVMKRSLSNLISGDHRLYVILDPYDVISETNESNNWAKLNLSVPDVFVIDDFEYDDSPLDHGWVIDAGTGTLSVVFDSTLNSQVMAAATGESTGFRVSHTAFDTPKRMLSLKMMSESFFILYVRVQTTIGEYYLQYTPDVGVDTVSGSYVYFHLGSSHQDTTWRSIDRDLAADVSSQLDASFSHVKFFVLRGAYRLDDLALSAPSTDVGLDPAGTGSRPNDFALLANYPNPFNSSTTLTYQLSGEAAIKLHVYNARGQRVITLAEGRQPAGIHSLTWNGQDESGLPVASGIYLYTLEVAGSRRIRKMVLLR
jgi:hypothetical protein